MNFQILAVTVPLKLVLQSLIVVVDGNRKNFFSLCLSNHVLVKVLANFPWSRDLLIQNRFAYCCSSRCLRIFCRRRRRSRQTGLLHCFGNNAGVFSQLASAVFANIAVPFAGFVNRLVLPFLGSAKGAHWIFASKLHCLTPELRLSLDF